MRGSSVLRRRQPDDHPGVSGVVTPGSSYEEPHEAAAPGEIAVIDHVDLDRVSAEALVSADVGGRGQRGATRSRADTPTSGPEILADAGIPLVDGVGPEIFARVDEGDVVRVRRQVALSRAS